MRRLLQSLLILLLGLPVLFFAGGLYLHDQLKQAGVTAWSFDLGSISLHQLQLERLQFTLDTAGYTTEAHLQDLTLIWSWPAFFRPQLQSVLLDNAKVQLLQNQSYIAPTAETSTITIPTDWALPRWLPQQLKAKQVTITTPCPAGDCQLRAALDLHSDDAITWQGKLGITSPDHQVTLNSDLHYQHLPTNKALQATLLLDQQFALSFKLQWDQQRKASTELALAASPPSSEQLALLADWHVPIPDNWVSQFSQPVQLYAEGNWQLPAVLDPQNSTSYLPPNAAVKLTARAPDAFIIPGIGWLKGDIQGELAITDSELTHWQLDAGLELSHYANEDIASYLAVTSLPPLQLQIKSTGSTQALQDALPVSLNIKADSPLLTALNAHLAIKLQPQLHIDIQQANLDLKIPTVKLPADAQLHNLTLKSDISGSWQANDWQLQLANNTQLQAELQHPEASSLLNLTLTDTLLKQHPTALVSVHTKPHLGLQKLTYTLLNQQDWQWQGELSGTVSALAFNGQFDNDAGLTMPHQIQWQSPMELTLDWQLTDIFLLAGNPLASTLASWPELLNVNRGRIGAAGQIRYQDNALQGKALLNLREVNGLYDRTLFSGLSTQVSLNMIDKQIQANINPLSINQINHGLVMGPLTLQADYQAALTEPLAGALSLTDVRMTLMQGELTVEPVTLDMASTEQQIILTINQLELAELLRQHPTTDLSANGKLSGRIPLALKNGQFTVAKGMLSAEEPGGRLQYRTAASAAGASNSSMKIVFDALEDFHFTLLNSEVSYHTDGQLQLALQLKGFNPALQQGRPINLNVNLEEDLPAMIASLQLANKLNDTLTKRVQQYIQQQQAAKAAAGESP